MRDSTTPSRYGRSLLAHKLCDVEGCTVSQDGCIMKEYQHTRVSTVTVTESQHDIHHVHYVRT